jgi:CysZ protein
MSNPGFLSGARAALRGFALLNTPGLRRYVAVPLAINLTLFGAALWFGARSVWDWSLTLPQQAADALPGWLGWLASPLQWLGWLLLPLFLLAALLLMYYSFTLLANLIGAPFNSLMAAQLEARLTGTPLAAANHPWWREALRAFGAEARKLLYFLIRALPLGLLFLIPVLNLAAAPLWLLFSAWMLGLGYLDYPMANHGILFAEQRARLKGRGRMVLGFGLLLTAASLVPVLNFFVMPAGVAGATALWAERLRPAAAARITASYG